MQAKNVANGKCLGNHVPNTALRRSKLYIGEFLHSPIYMAR